MPTPTSITQPLNSHPTPFPPPPDRRFFEGWYWRLTLPGRGQSFAVIYSVEDPGSQRPTSGVGAQIMGPNDSYLLQYEEGSAPALALQATKQRTEKRFANYAGSGLLCGTDGLPHLIADPGLALRYVLGHGPATDRDLSYWATLTLTDVRAGLASVASALESFAHDGRTFWHAPGESPPPRPRTPRVHLIHLLDEWYRGHQDSRLVVDAAGLHPVGREPSIGLLVVDAQIAGTVRRTVRPSSVSFEVTPYRPLTAAERRALDTEAADYGTYLGREAVLTVT